MEEYLIEAAKKLSFMAQTSGGVAGKDTVLINAIDEFEKALVKYQQEKHSYAARFAEWTSRTQWVYSPIEKIWWNKNPLQHKDEHEFEPKTTSQLLELFNK